MPVCPICASDVAGDDSYFAWHANQCLESQEEGRPSKRHCGSQPGDNEPVCPICALPFQSMLSLSTEHDQQSHVEACLMAAGGSAVSPRVPMQPGTVADESDGICPCCNEPFPAGIDPQVHASLCLDQRKLEFAGGQDEEMEDLMSNGSPFDDGSQKHALVRGHPGVIPIMAQLLQRVINTSGTRSATLCMPDLEYINGQITDLGWGCGYRNMQMMLSAARTYVGYQGAFKRSEDGQSLVVPSIEELQVLIERGWSMGFDPPGRDHFGGKLKGRRKWIGTTEVYVALTLLGIRARIYDFPKATGKGNTHPGLTSWVMKYFEDAPTAANEKRNAFDNMMKTDGTSVRRTKRPPLYLQHNGHSRTIVGVETMRNGDLHLLVYDPSKACPAKVRKAAAEDPPCKLQPASPSKRLLALVDPRSPLTLDDASRMLDTFRVSVKALSRNTQYQILTFEPGSALSLNEKNVRKHVTSTAIQ